MQEGMENIIANFYCNEMSTKYVSVCYQTTVLHLTFWKKSCSLGLARRLSTKLHNSKFLVNLYEIFRINVSSY